MKIGIIGVGKIGTAIARGLRNSSFRLFLYDKVGVSQEFQMYAVDSCEELVNNSDVIFVAVKPKDVYDVLTDISDLSKDRLVVSVAAGIRSDVIKKFVRRWARVMPNIPLEQREGVVAIYSSDSNDSELLAEIFKDLGKTYIVNSDDEIDIFTAVSASGPGYLAVLMESFEDAIVRAGLPRQIAREISAQTFLGTAKLILSGKSPSQIKDEVMTPAGTTAEAISHINEARKIIFYAVSSAIQRSKEISEILKSK